jgi:hypothetical protein
MNVKPDGEPAGKLGPHGYLWVEIDGVNYTAQDLAWMHVHGELPDGALVHLNGDRTDNRMENLHLVREADLTATDPKEMQAEIETIRKAERNRRAAKMKTTIIASGGCSNICRVPIPL